MWFALRKLALGFGLIAAASAVLLLSDWQRRTDRSADVPKIAILQYASRPLLDDTVNGMLDALAKEGFVNGKTISVQRYNAENDLPTANMISKEITTGSFRLVLTASTPCMQTVANANKEGKTIHVFAAVTDPFGAGVGISRENPLDHPKHLVGVGTFQPVERTFEIARQIFPGLKKVGVVWAPAEACSEACVLKARKKCKELGIELLEANVESSTAVLEAAHSVVARGAQALWIGGDNTVELAIDSLVAAAKAGKIPVFNNSPDIIQRGVLFALGADYHTVGALAGDLAARILKGLDPATVRIENMVPEKLAINTTVLAGLKDPWQIPTEIRDKAGILIGADGVQEKQTEAQKPTPGRKYKIGILYFSPDPGSDLVIRAIFDGLRDRGFVDGKNLDVRQAHAQGEIANITPILQNYDGSDVDLIVTMTTPCLTAACASVKRKPVVFTYVYDPLAAGAGKTRTEHLSFLTGVGSFPPLKETLALIRQIVPGVKTVGTLYNNAEANSRKVVEVARGIFEAEGVYLEEATASSSNEVQQTAQTLSHKGIDVLWISGDNTALLALSAIVNVALRAKLPLVINDVDFVDQGAVAACGIGFYKSGYEGGVLAARVLLGENPAQIPIEEVMVKQVAVNFAPAKALGVALPEGVLKESEFFFNVASRFGRPAKVALVQIVDNPLLDKSCEGVAKGLEQAQLKRGKDFTIQRFNAQGDASQLSLILSTIRSQGADLVVTAGTPTMIAAAKLIRDIPIVFTVSSDPRAVGVFQGDQRPSNLTGVHDDPPVEQLLALAAEREAKFDAVGTVWDPSQPNSEISVKKLRKVCAEKKLTLYESTVSAVSDLPQATESVCERGAKVLVVSADNLVAAGFPAVLAAAGKLNVPIYATEPGLVEKGAVAAVGDDYFEWGRQSGRLAAKVLAGVRPISLPLEKTAVQQTRIREGAPAPAAVPGRGKAWRISLVRYSDSPLSEDATKGFKDALDAAKLIAGRDYALQIQSAQGDIATLNTILSAIKNQGPDMVVVFSTPTLQAAVNKFDKTPIVFSVVADAVVAGAGKSATDHRPNVTGITTEGSFSEMPAVLKECLPSARRVGTVFCPSEDNSVHNKDTLAKHLKEAGIELVEAPASSAAEVNDAALSLCGKGIDAVCQSLDNLTSSSFVSIAKAAEKARLPVFGFVSTQPRQGAVLALSRDYHDAGVEAAQVALRVLRGENPADIPITNLKKTRLIVNLQQAQKLGLSLPDAVLRRADEVIK